MGVDSSQPDDPEPELVAALLAACSDGIVVYDLIGTVLWHNETARELVGLEPDELVGANGTDYIHPEDLETARQHWIEMLGEPGNTVSFQQRLVSVDGITRWCDVRMQNRLEDPVVNGVICYFHDITELREAEEALRFTHKQDVTGLLAGQLAHDFNNLLTAILGNADLALFELDTGDTSARQQMQAVRHAAEQAAVLTRRMLMFTRKHLTHRRAVDLGTLIHRQVPIVQTLIPEQSTLELAEDLDGGPSDPASSSIAWVDEHQFEQVLLNLVANARDAIGSEVGRITIALTTVTIEDDEIDEIRQIGGTNNAACAPGEYSVIRVTDTGHGIPAALLPNLFEPFVTTKAPGEGTGLGLSIVAAIVAESRGFVTIDSEVGQGTTVSVHVPRYFGDLGEPGRGRNESPDIFGAGTVIAVDDDQGVLNFVEHTLTVLGYQVFSASSYHEALEVFADHKDSIDLCLLDSVLPDQSGQSLARELTKVAAIPIVMMSGYVRDPTDDLTGIVVGLLTKPFGVHRLGEVVKRGIRAQPSRPDRAPDSRGR